MLHLTYCRRADFSATEARDLAREIDAGTVEVKPLEQPHPDGSARFGARRKYSLAERMLVVAALRAFA